MREQRLPEVGPSSEGRPQVKENLKTWKLRGLHAVGHAIGCGSVGGARDDKVRAVELIAEVDANRTDGSGVTNAEADGVSKIV